MAKATTTKTAIETTEASRIQLLVKSNPKRPNSKSAQRFAVLKNGMLLKDAFAAGYRRDDLAWDVKHGFVAVANGPSKAGAEKVQSAAAKHKQEAVEAKKLQEQVASEAKEAEEAKEDIAQS